MGGLQDILWPFIQLLIHAPGSHLLTFAKLDGELQKIPPVSL